MDSSNWLITLLPLFIMAMLITTQQQQQQQSDQLSR